MRSRLNVQTHCELMAIQDDTVAAVMKAPPPPSTQDPPFEPPSPSDKPSRPPREKRPIPTLTGPPAPPPKRILAGYIREAKAKQRKPAQGPVSAFPMTKKSIKTVSPASEVPSQATSVIPETATPADITKFPYYIQRIRPSGQLPIYTDLKAMGTLKQTRIRKISGDVHALKRELKEFLGIQKEKDCAVNPVTGHIILKGHWKSEVDGFLVAKGF